MSDDSSDEICVRRRSSRKSIDSDEEEAPHSATKRKVISSSSSDSSDKHTSKRLTPSKDYSDASAKSSSHRYSEATGKAFVKDTYESNRDLFLQDNASDDLDDFIDDREASEAGSMSSSEMEKSISEEESDQERIGEQMSSPVAEQNRQSEGEGNSTHCKRSLRIAIHSDESEPDQESEAETQSATPVSSPQNVSRRKKKKLRRVTVLSDSEAESRDNSGCTSGSESMLSDFIVDDSGSEVEGVQGDHSGTEIQLMSTAEAFLEIMRCMLLRALDPDYFSSEEFKADKYIAKAFSKIFSPLEGLLENLKSQAWCEEFTEALKRPEFSCKPVANYTSQECDACNKGERYASFRLTLHGSLYDKTSLKRRQRTDGEDDADSGDERDGEEDGCQRGSEGDELEASDIEEAEESVEQRMEHMEEGVAELAEDEVFANEERQGTPLQGEEDGDGGKEVTSPQGEEAGDSELEVTSPQGEEAGDSEQEVTSPQGGEAEESQQEVTSPQREEGGDSEHEVTSPQGEEAGDSEKEVTSPQREESGDSEQEVTSPQGEDAEDSEKEVTSPQGEEAGDSEEEVTSPQVEEGGDSEYEDSVGSDDTEKNPKCVFRIGKYCLERAELYHNALHFKYSLLDTCLMKTKDQRFENESADDIVEELTKNQPGWIEDHFGLYNDLLRDSSKLIRRRSKLREPHF